MRGRFGPVQAVVVTRSWRTSARSALPHGGEPARGYRRGVPFRISAWVPDFCRCAGSGPVATGNERALCRHARLQVRTLSTT